MSASKGESCSVGEGVSNGSWSGEMWCEGMLSMMSSGMERRLVRCLAWSGVFIAFYSHNLASALLKFPASQLLCNLQPILSF